MNTFRGIKSRERCEGRVLHFHPLCMHSMDESIGTALILSAFLKAVGVHERML